MSTEIRELERKIREQTVLKAELESLKSHKSVYVQQPNSNLYFKSDIVTALSDCKILLIQTSEPSAEMEKPRSSDMNVKLDFPKYEFKKQPNFENKFKNMYSKCEATSCTSFSTDTDRLNCVYKCMSNICYEKIYAFNPLEEGEFDQRFSSYKGCISQTI